MGVTSTKRASGNLYAICTVFVYVQPFKLIAHAGSRPIVRKYCLCESAFMPVPFYYAIARVYATPIPSVWSAAELVTVVSDLGLLFVMFDAELSMISCICS